MSDGDDCTLLQTPEKFIVLNSSLSSSSPVQSHLYKLSTAPTYNWLSSIFHASIINKIILQATDPQLELEWMFRTARAPWPLESPMTGIESQELPQFSLPIITITTLTSPRLTCQLTTIKKLGRIWEVRSWSQDQKSLGHAIINFSFSIVKNLSITISFHSTTQSFHSVPLMEWTSLWSTNDFRH